MRRAGFVTALAAVVLGVTGCGSGQTADAVKAPDAEQRFADTVMVGELASGKHTIHVGEIIPVVVDLPDDKWDVTNSDPKVVELSEGEADVAVVKVIGKKAGTSTVEFTTGDGDKDAMTVTVK
jgi:hypothetical protein